MILRANVLQEIKLRRGIWRRTNNSSPSREKNLTPFCYLCMNFISKKHNPPTALRIKKWPPCWMRKNRNPHAANQCQFLNSPKTIKIVFLVYLSLYYHVRMDIYLVQSTSDFIISIIGLIHFRFMLKMEIFWKKIYARARNEISWSMVNKEMIIFKDSQKNISTVTFTVA